MELQPGAENVLQCKSCRCTDGDGNIWAARASEGQDKLAPKCSNCQVFKSGPLFISSKGIGWTSWKKRWFVLTRTSLTFFRSDPSASTQKGNEGNSTLGGIELNNSGSVVVKADKKLLTVLFPDGRDGRAFTLKAETSEDLQEWKTALENALAQAPNAALVMGQNSMFRNDVVDIVESALEQGKDEEPLKSTIIGRPASHALKDVDGNPAFLEKALTFIEQHGSKIEGILRQSADVEEVKRRIAEYEQGKNEFSADEDGHVIADCIKYVLREMPSSPVPASCCTALLEAFRGDRASRVNRMSSVIFETFPEPNRRLLKRSLEMMRVVVSHKLENRMSVSAVAACMAPLLLRPLLAGDCELNDDFTMGGDSSLQLLQAAAAANHAQAIVIILLEEYDKIFAGDYLEDDSSSGVYSDSEDAYEEEEEEEEEEDDEEEYEYEDSTENEVGDDDCNHDGQNDTDAESEDDSGQASGGGSSESGEGDDDSYNKKESDAGGSDKVPPKVHGDLEVNKKLPDVAYELPVQHEIDKELPCISRSALSRNSTHGNIKLSEQCSSSLTSEVGETPKAPEPGISNSGSDISPDKHTLPSFSGQMSASVELSCSTKRRNILGRASARKNLSTESIEYVSDEEAAIQKLETTKMEMERKLAEEVKENERLQASLERRKQILQERRRALLRDVEKLQEQLQKERKLRASIEDGILNVQQGLPISSALDGKTRADLEEIAHAEADVSHLNKKVADLQDQLNDRNQNAHDIPRKLSGQRHQSIKRKELREGAIASTGRNLSLHRNKDAQSEEPSSNEKHHMLDVLSSSQPQQELHNSTGERNSKSTEKLTATTTSAKTSRCEDEVPQSHGSRSQQCKHTPEKQFQQSTSQDDNKDMGVRSSSVTEDASNMGAKSGLHACKSENSSSGTTSKSESQLPKDPSSLTNKSSKEKSRSSTAPSGGSSADESCMIGESLGSHQSKKRENLPSGTASKNNKPQPQELAPPQAPSGQSHYKQPEKAPTQDNEKPASVSSNSNEKTSLPRPDPLPPKLNNPSSGTSFDSLKTQQIPGSPPLRRRQPTRKTNSRMGSPATTVSPDLCASSLLPEDQTAVAAGSTSKKSSSRAEEAVSSTSTLTKLSNRLNFLKEKRVQLANELQALDLGRAKASEGPPTNRTESR